MRTTFQFQFTVHWNQEKLVWMELRLDVRLAVIPWQAGVVSKLMLNGACLSRNIQTKDSGFLRGNVP